MRYTNLKQTNDFSNLKGVTPGTNQKKSKNWFLLGIALGVVVFLLIVFGRKLTTLFSPVEVIANVSGAQLKETDGRTNVLILGSDKRSTGAVDSILTDTILVASIGKIDKNIVLISIPRDLWVESVSGYPSKINAVYANAGSENLKNTVSDVLGIPVHYYIVVDFELFEGVIDVLDGVEVTVDRAFTDYYYPVEGKENAPLAERYETVHFEEGLQVLDGATALKFVRSRKGDNGEGTDFARSKRQQKVIMAIKEKAMSLETFINPKKLSELYDLYKTHIDTDIDFATIQQFYLLSQQINFEGLRTVVLDDRSSANEGGLLYEPVDKSLYGGAYVLIPLAGDYSQIHAYVQKYLFAQ